jgi:hypothetical protein
LYQTKSVFHSGTSFKIKLNVHSRFSRILQPVENLVNSRLNHIHTFICESLNLHTIIIIQAIYNCILISGLSRKIVFPLLNFGSQGSHHIDSGQFICTRFNLQFTLNFMPNAFTFSLLVLTNTFFFYSFFISIESCIKILPSRVLTPYTQ